MVMDLKDKIAAINKKNEEDIRKNSKKRKEVKTKNTASYDLRNDSAPTVQFVEEECQNMDIFNRDIFDMIEYWVKIVLYISVTVLAAKIALVGF